MNIFISNNAEALQKKLAEYNNTATVEAEYGDTVVEGTLCTLAHHGPRQENPCPCMLSNRVSNTMIEAIGISHCDADTLGGIRALMDRKSDKEQNLNEPEFGFWYAMSKIDVMGPHHLGLIMKKTQEKMNSRNDNPDPTTNLANRTKIKGWINSFWAWSEKNRLYAPRDGSVLDVTDQIMWMQFSIDEIFKSYTGDDGLKDAGEAWRQEQQTLINDSFVGMLHNNDCSIVLRQSERFTNHLYMHMSNTKEDQILAVVASNPKTKTVTVSIADPLYGFSCGEFVKELWGDTAGGHAGIGGSPREGFITADRAEEEAYRAFSLLFRTLINKS